MSWAICWTRAIQVIETENGLPNGLPWNTVISRVEPGAEQRQRGKQLRRARPSIRRVHAILRRTDVHVRPNFRVSLSTDVDVRRTLFREVALNESRCRDCRFRTEWACRGDYIGTAWLFRFGARGRGHNWWRNAICAT